MHIRLYRYLQAGKMNTSFPYDKKDERIDGWMEGLSAEKNTLATNPIAPSIFLHFDLKILLAIRGFEHSIEVVLPTVATMTTVINRRMGPLD